METIFEAVVTWESGIAAGLKPLLPLRSVPLQATGRNDGWGVGLVAPLLDWWKVGQVLML